MARQDDDHAYFCFDYAELNFPEPPEDVGSEGNGLFAWLEGSQYWKESYDLPDAPSLTMSEGDTSSQLLRVNKRNDNENDAPEEPQSRIRFFRAIPKLPNVRALEEDEDALEHSLSKQTMPTNMRTTEIELVQRHLPSYPSQTHRKKPSFYPLIQDTLQQTSSLKIANKSPETDVYGYARVVKFLAFYRSRLQSRKERRAERREKCRLQEERREQQRAAKEARGRSQESSKRGRKQSYIEAASKEWSLPPTRALVDVSESPDNSEESSNKRRINASLDTSQSTIESYIPSTNESSVLLSSEDSFSDDDYISKELDYFYSEEKQKMKQVHSQHIEDTEREQRERRLDAERRAGIAMEEMEPQKEKDIAEATATRGLYHSKLLTDELEGESMDDKMGIKRDAESPPCHADSQDQFLQDSDLGVLKERLFCRNTDNDHVEEEKDISVSNDSERIGDPKPSHEYPTFSLIRSLSENIHSFTSSLPSNHETTGEHYEPQIGVISPSLQAQILQAQVEMRSRKVPEEHKKKFIPASLEASEVGRFTRLNEFIVEAYGTKRQEVSPLLPSAIWKRGQEHVSLPKVNDATASNTFTIFNEAAALGKIKALKPQVVANYDILSELNNDSEVDIDDENKHKVMRTNYLTDVYVQGHRQHKKEDLWIDADLREEIRYNSLEEVQLPTENCPVVKPATKKLSEREIKDAIAQAVAESAWDRRYRLERPHAEQRITRTCSCKYCENANPFQTHAYRKRWLVHQGLWNEMEEAVGAIRTPEVEMAEAEMVVMGEDCCGDELEIKQSKVSDGAFEPLFEDYSDLHEVETLVEDYSDLHEIATEIDVLEPVVEDYSGLHVDGEVLESAVEDCSDLQEAPVIEDYSDLHEVDCEIDNQNGDDRTSENMDVQNHEQGFPVSVNDGAVLENPFRCDASEEDMKDDTAVVKSNLERNWSTEGDALPEDSAPNPRKPRKKRSFLSEIGSVLGLRRVDDNDTSASAKAQRLRRTRRHNRQMKRKSIVRS
jgi:hypothetical protein